MDANLHLCSELDEEIGVLLPSLLPFGNGTIILTASNSNYLPIAHLIIPGESWSVSLHVPALAHRAWLYNAIITALSIGNHWKLQSTNPSKAYETYNENYLVLLASQKLTL